MESGLSKLPYGDLLSHTFPGLLLEVELIAAVHLFTPINIASAVRTIMAGNLASAISILGVLFVAATILGFVLDGVHHYVFRKWEATLNNEIFKYLTTTERMALVRQSIDEDYWYPYEAYANIFIAMLPGLFIVPYGLLYVRTNWIAVGVTLGLMIYVQCIMYLQAKHWLEQYRQVESFLIEGFRTEDEDRRTRR